MTWGYFGGLSQHVKVDLLDNKKMGYVGQKFGNESKDVFSYNT